MASSRPALTEVPQRNQPHWDRPVNSGPRPCLFSVGFPLSGLQDRTSTSDLNIRTQHTHSPSRYALGPVTTVAASPPTAGSGNIQTNNNRREVGPLQASTPGPLQVATPNGLSRQCPCLPATSRVCGYTPGLCHPVGCWLAWRPSPLCDIDPSLGATAHTPGSPAGASVRFLPRRRWPSPSTDRLGAPNTTAGVEHSQRELLVDTITTLQRSLNAAAPSVARPLDQPTSTRSWSGRRDLYFRAFTRGGRPPSAPDITTWAHRTSPRAGLAPAGSIRLRAAPVEVVNGRRVADH